MEKKNPPNDAYWKATSKQKAGVGSGCLMALVMLPFTALMGALRKLSR